MLFEIGLVIPLLMLSAKFTTVDPQATDSQRASKREHSIIDWTALVSQIKAGESAGIEQLYRIFNRGIRFYLCRQLGPQELEDRVHDVFLIVIKAIRREGLREPERLMGFVRTVVKRQVAAHIDQIVHLRREQADLEMGMAVTDREHNPEQQAMIREQAELMKRALSALSERDRDVLIRFYLKEQGPERICRELGLSETQFRLLKSRAKAKLGEIGRKKMRTSGTLSQPAKATVA